jgi:protein-tyrosine phosphatase/arsenate reductase
MFEPLKNHCDQLVNQFDTIPTVRKELLTKISDYIHTKKDLNLPIKLMYVCTHNSRRSHFGQIWAAVAASYFGVENVHTFSGGTEATAFNPNTIQALKETGFEISTEEHTENPIYKVAFGTKETQFTICFSKVYDDSYNPSSNFAAIMTCSDAEQNCPFIPGVELRIGTTYADPKAFDGTPQQAEKYLERSNQIALECLFVFSKISYS